jgi:hypothetical protein
MRVSAPHEPIVPSSHSAPAANSAGPHRTRHAGARPAPVLPPPQPGLTPPTPHVAMPARPARPARPSATTQANGIAWAEFKAKYQTLRGNTGVESGVERLIDGLLHTSITPAQARQARFTTARLTTTETTPQQLTLILGGVLMFMARFGAEGEPLYPVMENLLLHTPEVNERVVLLKALATRPLSELRAIKPLLELCQNLGIVGLCVPHFYSELKGPQALAHVPQVVANLTVLGSPLLALRKLAKEMWLLSCYEHDGAMSPHWTKLVALPILTILSRADRELGQAPGLLEMWRLSLRNLLKWPAQLRENFTELLLKLGEDPISADAIGTLLYDLGHESQDTCAVALAAMMRVPLQPVSVADFHGKIRSAIYAAKLASLYHHKVAP